MFDSLKYKLKKKKYGVHFGEDDIFIGDIILNSVHAMPENEWQSEQEADFYMDDKSDIYILRIINSSEYKITLTDCVLRYIIIRIPVKNINGQLGEIITALKKIPYNKKLHYAEETYDFPYKKHHSF
ncbi:MAG: hypothetical protein K2J08_11630 [Ruminococcus sp.]|nr:hypothetical protein [Ruminococcus sp.]